MRSECYGEQTVIPGTFLPDSPSHLQRIAIDLSVIEMRSIQEIGVGQQEVQVGPEQRIYGLSASIAPFQLR